MPIIIKTPLNEAPVYRFRVESIPEPESWIKKKIREYTHEPRQEIKFAGRPEFDPVTVTIVDEINVDEWVNTARHPNSNYKKELYVTDKNGFHYTLKGCWPISFNKERNDVTLVVDCWTLEEAQKCTPDGKPA
jgi:hypothetical protein